MLKSSKAGDGHPIESTRDVSAPLLGLRRLERVLAVSARRNAPFLILVVAGFVARFFLADWNSYWYDELLSVTKYGLANESSLDVARQLAEQSIHPPLYQMALFHWIQVFGDSEIATRSLSNLYIAGATFFMYLFVAKFAPRAVAFGSAALFTIMYSPTASALETRSYAQTIFLVCLSGYLLIRVFSEDPVEDLKKPSWRSPALLLLTISNAALLLTHYYNFFFWTAQAAFALAYAVVNRRSLGSDKLRSLAGSFVAQPILFAGIWGSVFLADYRRRAPSFQAEVQLKSPVSILLDNVEPNLRSPAAVLWLLAAVSGYLFVRALFRVRARQEGSISVWRSWWLIYLVVWMTGPVFVATAAFEVTGVARYNFRYFLYCVPAIAPLLSVAIAELVKSARRTSIMLRFAITGRALYSSIVLLAAVLWVLPGAHTAATERKHDWRGVVSSAIQVVESDESNSYVIIEGGHHRDPMSNYYFERLSDGIRADFALLRSEEREGRHPILDERRDEIEQHDRLIVLFLHSRTSANSFPNALRQLEERYDEQHRQLRFGRGYIVFDLG